jgi:PAS domain S-box-containing protein
MKKKPPTTADRSDLRRRAEGRLGASGGSIASGAPEAQRLAHEIEVHKTELGLLNEELERTRAKAEEALARYAELYELAPVGYLTLGLDGTIQRVNITGARLVGLDRSKLVGKRFELLVVAEGRAAFNAFLAQAFESRSTRTCEVLLDPAGATPVVLELTATASDDGQECRVVATDITDRKRAERELEESRHLVESVVENVPLMIFLKEAQDLRFVVFNRAGEELLGYDRKDLLGKNNLDLFPPEQAAFFMAKDREVLASDALLDIPEEPILTAKKGQRWLHTRKLCIKGADGITKYLLGISEDITDRKRAEERIALQLDELKRWQDIMLGREDRVQELKREVNDLCRRTGDPVRYPSQEAGTDDSEAAKRGS